MPLPQEAGDLSPRYQTLEAAHGLEAGVEGARGAIEPMKLRQAGKVPIDLPKKHGGASGRAAQARPFAVDQHAVCPSRTSRSATRAP